MEKYQITLKHVKRNCIESTFKYQYASTTIFHVFRILFTKENSSNVNLLYYRNTEEVTLKEEFQFSTVCHHVFANTIFIFQRKPARLQFGASNRLAIAK